MILQCIITCPNCGMAKAETMLTDACQFFYDCNGCGARLKPSHGDLPCPAVQESRTSGAPTSSAQGSWWKTGFPERCVRLSRARCPLPSKELWM